MRAVRRKTTTRKTISIEKTGWVSPGVSRSRVVLIHGNDESSVEWFAWVPRMAQEYRLIRP